MAESCLTRLCAGVIRLSMSGLDRGPHVTRYFMYRRMERLRLEARPDERVLSVSDSKRLAQIVGLGRCETVEVSFPEYDILDLPFEAGSFDYIVSDQVLEHVRGNPQDAIDESRRVLRPGGMAVHTTCFINPLHEEPDDLWRFAPSALRYLCRDWSEIVEVGGWGNQWVWVVERLGLRFDGVPEARWHPMHRIAMLSDPRWPVVTWVIARK